MSSSLAVANEFIKKAQAEGNHSLTNMKLQKLVYITHGFALAVHDKPLLDKEDVYAWQFGPVIKDLYDRLRFYGSGEVTQFLPAPHEVTDSSELELIDAVWQGYGHHSAYALSAVTHEPNTPWTNTWNETRFGVISNNMIRDHYKQILNEH
jgi:uncharacterized phage-associated protein